jgi:hypothetical protein
MTDEKPDTGPTVEQRLAAQLAGLPTDLQVALMGLVDATIGLDEEEKETLEYQVRGLVRAVDRPRIRAADGSTIEARDPLTRLLKSLEHLLLAADAAAHGQTIRQRLGDRARNLRGPVG